MDSALCETPDSGEPCLETGPAPAATEVPSPRLSPIPESEIEEWVAEAIAAEEEGGLSEA